MFGEWLAAQAKRRGISLNKLADLADCSVAYLSQITREDGKGHQVDRDLVRRLAVALNLDPDEAYLEAGWAVGETRRQALLQRLRTGSRRRDYWVELLLEQVRSDPEYGLVAECWGKLPFQEQIRLIHLYEDALEQPLLPPGIEDPTRADELPKPDPDGIAETIAMARDRKRARRRF